MKRTATVLMLLTAVFTGVNAQLLYRISGGSLAKPSYIVGTYHLAPVSFADSVAGLRDAMGLTEQVCGELDMQQVTTPEGMQKMMQAMMLPGGKTLKDILSPEELARLNAFMTTLIGTDMTNPMVEQQMGRMTPQALNTQFTLMMYMKQTPGVDPANLIDGYFQKAAMEKGKPVVGLETVDFQIRTLFHGMTTERQKQLLMCLVDNSDYYSGITAALAKAYFSQDINRIKAVMDEKQNTACDSTPEEDAALIYTRNADWLTKMPAIMAGKPTLFAVGAGHLPGSKGLLNLLRDAGYTVEAVK